MAIESVVLIFSCRFLLGGDHGRLKYIPPEEFSPLVESLLPQQVLSIDPCFYFGNLNKVVLSGPWPVEDDTAFVPTPVDTTTVSKATIYSQFVVANTSERKTDQCLCNLCRQYLCSHIVLVLKLQ